MGDIGDRQLRRIVRGAYRDGLKDMNISPLWRRQPWFRRWFRR